MYWYKDALSDIYQPFNLRGLFNKNKLFVMEDGYELFMDRLRELEIVHNSSKLDIETLSHIRDDVEAARERLNYLKEQGMKINDEGDICTKPQTVFDSYNKVDKLSPSSEGVVNIEIVELTGKLLEDVEREVILIASKKAKTQVHLAKILGCSERTVKNKIKKYFDGYLRLDR